MYLLSTLPYTEPVEFTITVEKIKYGYMSLHLNVDGVEFRYAPSELCDPLNDLLIIAALILDGCSLTVDGKVEKKAEHTPLYEYVFHDLEGYYVIWLLKYFMGELTIIIWDCDVSDVDTLETLADNDFNSNALEIRILDKLPDFHEYLKFALKCKPALLANALVGAVEGLKNLANYNSSNWGFSYSESHFDKLKQWLALTEENQR